MIALLAGAALALPPAVALSDCRPATLPTWQCGSSGEITLTERAVGEPESTLSRITRPDGVEVSLVRLPGDQAYAATWTEGGVARAVEGHGPRGPVERALLEWAVRGGPGGGPLKLGDVILELPLGCWVADGTATCADGSAATIGARGAVAGGTPLGDIACNTSGRPARCRVDATADALRVAAANGARELLCYPGSSGIGGDACAGLTWDAKALDGLLPTPATEGCRLGMDQIWSCRGARVVARPWKPTLGLPRDLPPQVVKDVWLSTVDGVFRGCEGPSLVCGRILGDWAAHPPGTRSADLFGQPLAIPTGCDLATEAGRTAVVCEAGVFLSWSARGTGAPRTSAKSCKVLGLRATCVTLSDGGREAVLEDVPGTVVCSGDWCARIGL